MIKYWYIMRTDDTGRDHSVEGRFATQKEAQDMADDYNTSGHKQFYWVDCYWDDGA